MEPRPALSVVIAVREGLAEIAPVLAGLRDQARRTGTEILVVGAVREPAPEGVRIVHVDDGNIFALRMIGIHAARGEVVAMGEDHAVPRPDWCDAVLRAHAERPGAPAIAGCLVNASDATLGGRANFLGFAAPYTPPMPVLPALRPPPISMLSFKRAALAEVNGRLGQFETELVPRLHAEGRMVADDRVVVDHYQDHGVPWAIVNAFHGARAAYGYVGRRLTPRQRVHQARWSLRNWPRRIAHEARRAGAADPGARAAVRVAMVIGLAVGVGGAVGVLAGPGRSPHRVA